MDTMDTLDRPLSDRDLNNVILDLRISRVVHLALDRLTFPRPAPWTEDPFVESFVEYAEIDGSFLENFITTQSFFVLLSRYS